MQYYPSGLPWENSISPSEQPFKYGSKEFVEMHGLDEYDSEARWYYPAIMRTTTMDPMCEKYYSTSPYAWCSNNPVNFVDPDGRDDHFDQYGNFQYRDDKETDYIMVQLENGAYQNLVEFDYSEDQTDNRNMLSNVASHYAQQVGFNQTIDVCDKEFNDAMAATEKMSDFPQVYIIVANGKLSPKASTSNNIMNTFVHEEEHVEKRIYNAMAEVFAIIRQMSHPTWFKTTDGFQMGIVGYLLENANEAIQHKEEFYELIPDMIKPFGLPITFFNNQFSFDLNEIECVGVKIK
jgi:RHS repeat-associated protein